MAALRFLRLLVIALGMAISPAAMALQPDEILPDAALETRARALSAELRCLVCQNQSIDDSDAPLARDLRMVVRERLVAGDDDREVMRFLVERYGEFILLRPPFKASTIMLWVSPLLALLAGIAFLVIAWRRRQAAIMAFETQSQPLTQAEQEALARLLDRR